MVAAIWLLTSLSLMSAIFAFLLSGCPIHENDEDGSKTLKLQKFMYWISAILFAPVFIKSCILIMFN